MRVQTLLNKNSKLNPSGGTRPPIRFFSFFFFLLQATAQKYLWLQRNMEKNNKSRVDLRFRDLTQKQEKQVEAFCPTGGSVVQAFSTRVPADASENFFLPISLFGSQFIDQRDVTSTF